jgi:phage shock protein A
MNIFGQLFNALKGGANEMGEALVDANDITIFEQELRDAKANIAKAKQIEVSIVARVKQAEAIEKETHASVLASEDLAKQALDQDNEDLALEHAGNVVTLSERLSAEQDLTKGLKDNLSKIRAQITRAELELKEMDTQLSQVKATDSVHKAQASLHAKHNSAASARESLARIKAKQAEQDAFFEVSESLSSADRLDEKLAEAGISKESASAQKVLQKLKSQN